MPNLFRLVANSPSALQGYVALFDALNKGSLPAPTRERIALAVSEARAMFAAGATIFNKKENYYGSTTAAFVYVRNRRQLWRNRLEFLQGRVAIEAFLPRKWARELDYHLIKEVWTPHLLCG